MKRILIVIGILSTVLTHAQIKKAAIISIYGDKNLSDNPLETKLYEALLEDDSFDLTPTVVEFEKMIEENVVPKFSFPFLSKDEVISNQEYIDMDSRYMENVDEDSSKLQKFFQSLVPAEGYKSLASFGIVNDKKAILKAFEIFPDVDAVLIAFIDYRLYEGVGAFGMSKMKVNANANIKLFNKEGKRIFKLKESESSKKGVLGVAGIIPEPEKLKPVIADATKQLFANLEKKIAKSMKKMAKKLK